MCDKIAVETSLLWVGRSSVRRWISPPAHHIWCRSASSLPTECASGRWSAESLDTAAGALLCVRDIMFARRKHGTALSLRQLARPRVWVVLEVWLGDSHNELVVRSSVWRWISPRAPIWCRSASVRSPTTRGVPAPTLLKMKWKTSAEGPRNPIPILMLPYRAQTCCAWRSRLASWP